MSMKIKKKKQTRNEIREKGPVKDRIIIHSRTELYTAHEMIVWTKIQMRSIK